MALVATAAPQWNRASRASALASAAVTSVLGLITLWYLRRQCPLPVKRRCTDEEVLAEAEEVRRRYCLSEAGGFLPNDCLDRLPAEFDAWEAIASDLPRLNASKALAARVEALPVLTLGQHRSPEVLRRAYVLLGALVHSYVHRHEVPWHCLEPGAVAETDGRISRSSCRKVPKALAQPWLEVCELLSAAPVLTAAATDLWNWRKKDAALGFDPGNLEQRISLTGTSSERVFHMVPCAMQAAAREVVPKIFLADRLIVGERQEELALLLLEVADVLGSFKSLFAQIPKGVDPDVFYDIYRPLLNGFHPGLIMEVATAPDNVPGLKLESGGLMNQCKGPSAGQSSVILMLDIFLSVSHVTAGKAFQEEMLMYMPAEHRQMLLDFSARWQAVGGIPEFVRKCQVMGQDVHELSQAYNECLAALTELRRFHLATVRRYLMRTAKGTGATTWRMLLQDMLDATQAALLR